MNNFRPHARLALLSAAGAVCNVLLYVVFVRKLGLPLYLDTIFTMTLAFLGGPLWGALTGLCTNIILHCVWYGGLLYFLFALCNIAVALVTALFVRFFPAELDVAGGRPAPVPAPQSQRFVRLLDLSIVLILLSFGLCIAISILGGLIGTLIKTIIPNPNSGTELRFLSTLVRKNLPLVLVETLSRIPVNIIDRPVSAFCAYRAARLLRGVVYAETPQ